MIVRVGLIGAGIMGADHARILSQHKPAGAAAWDGYTAALVAEAGVRSLESGGLVEIAPVAKPALY